MFDLLSVKLLHFRLIITYFGMFRVHQIAPFLLFVFGRAFPSHYHLLIFIKTLKDANQIYILKLNMRIGPNSNLKKRLLWLQKINALTLSEKKVLICWEKKTAPPPPKN